MTLHTTAGAHSTGRPSNPTTPVSRMSLGWGAVVGVGTALAPLAFWWLPAATVYAVGLVFIAAIYIGFAVADGRGRIVALETTVATGFVLLAAVALTGSPWVLVGGYAGHGIKDLWQHRTGFVANTRWWPPFCVTVDWITAALIAAAIMAGHALR